jgi:hypothetical protein
VIFPWGFWVLFGIVLGVALLLMPMAFRPEPPPRRPSISRPSPRAPAMPQRALPASPTGPVSVAARSHAVISVVR